MTTQTLKVERVDSTLMLRLKVAAAKRGQTMRKYVIDTIANRLNEQPKSG